MVNGQTLTDAQFLANLMIQSLLGWGMEVILKMIQYRRFINRGFMVGPYCPIYGTGVVIMSLCIGGTIGSYSGYFLTFALAFVLCGVLEFMVSFIMEKFFHARWWDYSQKPLNLQGRIWIGNLILFGLGGIIIVKWGNPVFFGLLSKVPKTFLEILALVLAVVMVLDFVTSNILFHMVKKEIDGIEADNSEEISKKVHELLRNRSALMRRISYAYPNLTAIPKKVTEVIEEEIKKIS